MSSQLLASLEDVKTWLPDDKLKITDGSTADFQVTTYRIIKSQLSGVFTPTILNGWSSPSSTPGIIRDIAGRLIGAYVYREAYSEDSPEIPAYAQGLYNEAMDMLMKIREGNLVVVDDNDIPIGGGNQLDMTEGDFYPDKTAPGPFFTMTKQFS